MDLEPTKYMVQEVTQLKLRAGTGAPSRLGLSLLGQPSVFPQQFRYMDVRTESITGNFLKKFLSPDLEKILRESAPTVNDEKLLLPYSWSNRQHDVRCAMLRTPRRNLQFRQECSS